MGILRIHLAGIGLAIAALSASAVQDRLAFEVVSIKPGDPSAGGGTLQFQPGGRVVAANITVLSLIQSAYRTDRPLLLAQIEGLPQWATTARYNVSARISTDTPTDATAAFSHVSEYLRSLLEDRFSLKAHMEKRDAPVYALRVPEGGQPLRLKVVDCTKPGSGCGIRFGVGHVTGQMTLGNLVGSLSGPVGRVVIDETHLSDRYDVDLQWNATNDAASDQPSIFAAVQEQLGLKLEPSRASVDTLVIDHVERPTEN